jgi:predicted phage terminase large subunit-like protein
MPLVGTGSDDAQVLRALLRWDFASFAHKTFATVSPAAAFTPNWHIEAMAWHLEQCCAGTIRRLIIAVPPRYLKSICASVALPAWALGRDPARRIICASYSNELTAKHARDCRAVMESNWYRAIFPKTRINPYKNTELEFETTARGYRYGTSVGGTLTGRGGNLIIVDDPMKPADGLSEVKRESVNQWFDGTLYSRLDSKSDDAIVIIMQRLHIDDLVGHVSAQEDWTILSLPAIADEPQRIPTGPHSHIDRKPGDVLHPAREPRSVLHRIKETIGSYNFSAQYQQCPVPPGGALIRAAWLHTYRDIPPQQPGDRIVQSWDTASKAEEIHDWSVCTTWLVQKELYYLLAVFRRRLEYPELKRTIAAQAQMHGADTVLIEDKASGTSLIQDLCQEGSLHPIAVVPEADKLTRMASQSAKIEAGRVLFPEDAPWLGDFLTEILQFPHGRHDDQIDSLSQFLHWVTRPRLEPRISCL